MKRLKNNFFLRTIPEIKFNTSSNFVVPTGFGADCSSIVLTPRRERGIFGGLFTDFLPRHDRDLLIQSFDWKIWQ